MNKPSWFAIALTGIGTICAAQTSPAPKPTPTAGQSGLSKSMANGSGTQLSTGMVTEYKAGERIAVKVADDNVITLDLERNVRVDGLVAVGQLAAVMWMEESGGRRRVTSITAAPGPGDSGMANLASSYQQMSETPGPKGSVTPGPSPTSGPTILTPKAGSTTPRTTSTPSQSSRTTPTPTP